MFDVYFTGRTLKLFSCFLLFLLDMIESRQALFLSNKFEYCGMHLAHDKENPFWVLMFYQFRPTGSDHVTVTFHCH